MKLLPTFLLISLCTLTKDLKALHLIGVGLVQPKKVENVHCSFRSLMRISVTDTAFEAAAQAAFMTTNTLNPVFNPYANDVFFLHGEPLI